MTLRCKEPLPDSLKYSLKATMVSESF